MGEQRGVGLGTPALGGGVVLPGGPEGAVAIRSSRLDASLTPSTQPSSKARSEPGALGHSGVSPRHGAGVQLRQWLEARTPRVTSAWLALPEGATGQRAGLVAGKLGA